MRFLDRDEPAGRTALSIASFYNREGVVNLLLSRGDVDVHLKDETGETALSKASGKGHEAIVRLLRS